MFLSSGSTLVYDSINEMLMLSFVVKSAEEMSLSRTNTVLHL